MSIVSKPASAEYLSNFDATFGSKPKRPNECRIYNTTCPTPNACRPDLPDGACLAGQVNEDTGEGSMTLGGREAKLEKGDGE